MEILILLRRYTWLAQWDNPADVIEKDGVRSEARGRLGPLEARLVLDEDGQQLSRLVTAMARDVEHYESMVRTQSQLVQQHAPAEAILSYGQKADEQWKGIQSGIEEIADKARAVVQALAKPLPGD